MRTLVYFCVSLAITLSANATLLAQVKAPLEIAKNLNSDSMEARKEAAKDFSNLRKQHISLLLQLAQVKEDAKVYRGSKELAIELLGEARALEAIPFLVKHLTYRVLYDPREPSSVKPYPSARALIAIGSPSYPELRLRLAQPVKDVELKLMAYIVRAIDGHELGLARLELFRRDAHKIVTVDGPVLRNNLDDLIKHYKTKATDF